MKSVREELVQSGAKIAAALRPASGGSISAREKDIIWIQPDDFDMDEMCTDNLCGINLKSGQKVKGKANPSPDIKMHLGVYHSRPDIVAVFHTHSAWVTGVISAGKPFKPMFAEFVNDLGRTGSIPFVSSTSALARRISHYARNHETIFMVNHGLLTVGVNLKQAYYRCVVTEDAAKSLFAASITGKPLFLNQKKVKEILALDAVQHRIKMMETTK